mmetsp:Transcript_26276/g.57342  ORF Transcript_26276/g.57342 Transcript_26276/m.57342 type:complete len:232 (+) Transcript_26276:425-1120(+)
MHMPVHSTPTKSCPKSCYFLLLRVVATLPHSSISFCCCTQPVDPVCGHPYMPGPSLLSQHSTRMTIMLIRPFHASQLNLLRSNHSHAHAILMQPLNSNSPAQSSAQNHKSPTQSPAQNHKTPAQSQPPALAHLYSQTTQVTNGYDRGTYMPSAVVGAPDHTNTQLHELNSYFCHTHHEKEHRVNSQQTSQCSSTALLNPGKKATSTMHQTTRRHAQNAGSCLPSYMQPSLA